MNKEKFNTYIDLQLSKRELEVKIEALKPEILAEMEKDSVDEVTIADRGIISVISVGVKRTYKYPARIEKLEAELKLEKEKSEAKGEAIPKETRYPIFKSIKAS